MLLPGIKVDSIAVFKSKREMIIYDSGKTLKKYNISLGKNPVGHKEKEGDKKTPEGFYTISGRNPNSKFHYSLRISYPDENDKKRAETMGFFPGGDIMIHGFPNITQFLEEYYVNNDWTDGCIAVTNTDMDELKDAVEDGTKISIYK